MKEEEKFPHREIYLFFMIVVRGNEKNENEGGSFFSSLFSRSAHIAESSSSSKGVEKRRGKILWG